MNEIKCGFQVYIDDHVPLLFRHADHQSVTGNPRVVHKDVDPSEVFYDFSNHGMCFFKVGRIGGISLRFDAQGGYLFFGFQSLFIDR